MILYDFGLVIKTHIIIHIYVIREARELEPSPLPRRVLYTDNNSVFMVTIVFEYYTADSRTGYLRFSTTPQYPPARSFYCPRPSFKTLIVIKTSKLYKGVCIRSDSNASKDGIVHNDISSSFNFFTSLNLQCSR